MTKVVAPKGGWNNRSTEVLLPLVSSLKEHTKTNSVSFSIQSNIARDVTLNRERHRISFGMFLQRGYQWEKYFCTSVVPSTFRCDNFRHGRLINCLRLTNVV